MRQRAARRFDIVLFGATGFTGRLVADYLAGTAGGELRWALAGRDGKKLGAIRDQLLAAHPAQRTLEILVGDALDPDAMQAIAADTRVICTTVGPYGRYGSALVAACAAQGTDYCDLAGEVPWIRRMIDAHDQAARRTGARIVHACGFDSVPSDLGVLFLQEEMLRAYGHPASRVEAHFEMKGGLSGGTFASMIDILDQAADPDTRRLLANPYALTPDPGRRGPDRDDVRTVGYDRHLGRFTAPFVMAAINTRVVRRSNALLGYRYGEDFRYREVTSMPGSPRGLATAIGYAAGLAGLAASMSVRWLRRRVEPRLPRPGQGPSQEQRQRGYFAITFVGDSGPDGAAHRLVVKVGDQVDPGYGSTAKMLGEAARCLAFDDLPVAGGVLTPAASMGMALVDRLRRAGLTFEAAGAPGDHAPGGAPVAVPASGVGR